MKQLLLLLLFAAMSSQPLFASQREALINRLAALQTRGMMFGHQDDPFYGTSWEWEHGRSDVLESCGDYPAVMGFDLGGIEMGDEKNLDSVPFTRIREELLAHVERGGIVTVSWHPRNPLTGGTAWDCTDTTVVESILPGGTQHRKFLLWMKNVRNFLKSLRTANDRPVPFIFRPWHENNGAWFWWGAKQCTPQQYRALWCMLQDYLLSEGLENIVWSWSPNLWDIEDERLKIEDGLRVEKSSIFNLQSSIFDTYPGDDRVDLIGLDAYQWGTEEDFTRQLDADLRVLSGFAAERGKLLALTECGLQNMPDPTWWTRVLKPQIDKYPLCYFLVWRNARKEFYGPVPGSKNALYFNEMIKNRNILMLKDITK